MLYFDLIVVFHVALDKRWYINGIVAVILTAFRMGFFRTAAGGGGGWGGAKRPPFLKSATHPTMIKLVTVIPYPKKT